MKMAIMSKDGNAKAFSVELIFHFNLFIVGNQDAHGVRLQLQNCHLIFDTFVDKLHRVQSLNRHSFSVHFIHKELQPIKRIVRFKRWWEIHSHLSPSSSFFRNSHLINKRFTCYFQSLINASWEQFFKFQRWRGKKKSNTKKRLSLML